MISCYPASVQTAWTQHPAQGGEHTHAELRPDYLLKQSPLSHLFNVTLLLGVGDDKAYLHIHDKIVDPSAEGWSSPR